MVRHPPKMLSPTKMRFGDINHELFFGRPVKALSIRPLRLPYDFIRYHLWTCFLFVVDDIKTIIIPCVSSSSFVAANYLINYLTRPYSHWLPHPFHALLSAWRSSSAGYSSTCFSATSLTRARPPSRTKRTSPTVPSRRADCPTRRRSDF